MSDVYIANERRTRSDFEDRARRIASVLKQAGVGLDDLVAVLMRNDIAYLEIAEACRRVGAFYVPLNWHAAPAEIAAIISDAKAKVLFAHSDLLAALGPEHLAGAQVLTFDAPAPVRAAYPSAVPTNAGGVDMEAALSAVDPLAGDPLPVRGIFAYTSGSTGRPKGIRRIREDPNADRYVVFAQLARTFLQLAPGDRFYTAAPIYHSAPNTLSNISLAAGDAEVHLAARFDAEGFLRDVAEKRITHAYMVPTMMIRLLKLPAEVRAAYDVSSLKYAVSTGSAWPADVKEAMIKWFGPIFFESYGASEIGFMTLISSQEALARPGSVGKVLPGGSIRILDDDGNDLPPNTEGMIYVHLPMFGDFEYTNADGNLKGQRSGPHTSVGDIGRLDEDGYLYISDRKKDMIITGGANVFPAEVEAALIDMPAIVDCAVFGAPDPEFGEKIVAAVTVAPGKVVTLATVQDFLQSRLAAFKIPKVVDVHETLPREDTGKVFKQRLRAPYWEQTDRRI